MRQKRLPGKAADADRELVLAERRLVKEHGRSKAQALVEVPMLDTLGEPFDIDPERFEEPGSDLAIGPRAADLERPAI